MNLEVQDKITAFSFSYDQIEDNLPVNIVTATIIIYTNGGSVKVNSTPMTVSNNNALYTVDFSLDPDNGTWEIDRNYKAELKIDGNLIPILFDIVKYPFINVVKDQDLFDESHDLEEAAYTDSGNATGGTTTTLIDTSLIQLDNYWNGGKMKIWTDENDDLITEHLITAFSNGTNEITFIPPRATVNADDNYTLRRSYQKRIDDAGRVVQVDLWKKNLRAYLVLDDYQLKLMITYKALERYFGSKKNSNAEDDIFDDRYIYYKGLYDEEFNNLPLNYDRNEDGNIDPDTEERTPTTITLNR